MLCVAGRILRWPPRFSPLLSRCEQDMPENMMGYHIHAYVVLHVKRDFTEEIKVPSQLTLC